MLNSLLPFFHWVDRTTIGNWVRDSTWAFASIEVIHLFGLTLLLGTLVVVNLRMFGWGLTANSLADVASDAIPFMISAMVVTIITGMLLFSAETMKCYDSPPFIAKMVLLAAALLFTFTFHRHLTKKDRPPSPASKFAACLSMALWVSVGLAGRAIAFF